MADAQPLPSNQAITLASGGDTPVIPPRAPGEPPNPLAGYTLGRRLGTGGMGAVYLASDEAGHEVALKIMRPELAHGGDFADRFRREAAVMTAVADPNVVRALASGEDRGWLWLALEYMADGDLERYLKRRGQLMEKDAVQMAIQCARGLAAIHAQGLVHRDFKPANVFLAKSKGTAAGTFEAKIGDLGLARHTSGNDRMTLTGTACGTPAYMAPEQVRGESDLDPRVDVYALGATLYRLVTGQDPFQGSTIYMLTNAVLKDPVPDPRKHNPTVCPALVGIILKAMSKDRADRFTDTLAVAADLERVAAGRNLHHAAAVPSPASMIFNDVAGQAAPKHQILSRSVGGGMFTDLDWKPVLRLALPAAIGCAALWGLLSLMDGKTVVRPDRATAASAAGTAAAAAPGAAVSEDGKGPVLKTPVLGRTLAWRWCPPGQGPLGARAGRPSENPRTVQLSTGYWMLDSEVDQALWSAVLGEESGDTPDLPASGMTYDQAETFCQELGRQLGNVPVRLPSEAEWEWAARAGAASETAATELDRVASHAALITAWAIHRSASETPLVVEDAWRLARGDAALAARPTGSGTGNAWGLKDLLGNVQEWCCDRWDGTSPATDHAIDPLGKNGSLRAIRGGSWLHPGELCRSGARFAGSPGEGHPWVGLRPVISAGAERLPPTP